MAPVSIAIMPEQLSTSALAMKVGATARLPRSCAGPEHHADLGAVLVGQLEARVSQRLLCGRDAEMHARFAAADRLRIHPGLGVEVAHLAGKLRLIGRGVEIGDLIEA
jgi:hypothetical protein